MGEILRTFHLETLPCPTAYVARRTRRAVSIAAGELVGAGRVLGHRIEDPAGIEEAVDRACARHDGGSVTTAVTQVALVPSSLTVSSGTPWVDVQVVAWERARPDSGPLRVARAPWPLNETSPTAPWRFTADLERRTGLLHALDHGADLPLWMNLRGHCVAIHDWTLIVRGREQTVTPAPASGAPVNGWVDGLVAAGLIERGTIPPEDVAGADHAPVAVTPWGSARAITVDGSPVEPSAAFAAELQAAMRSFT